MSKQDTQKRSVEEFRLLLKKTRMMRSDVADYLGVSERTIVRWGKGATDLPLWSYVALRELIDRRTGGDSVTPGDFFGKYFFAFFRN